MTKHTPGPWLRDGDFLYALTEIHDRGKRVPVNRFGASFQRGEGCSPEELRANAELTLRLANLYFAGQAYAAQQDADTITKGDLPADRDFGLSEDAQMAAKALNALMVENEAQSALLRRLAEFNRNEEPSLQSHALDALIEEARALVD